MRPMDRLSRTGFGAALAVMLLGFSLAAGAVTVRVLPESPVAGQEVVFEITIPAGFRAVHVHGEVVVVGQEITIDLPYGQALVPIPAYQVQRRVVLPTPGAYDFVVRIVHLSGTIEPVAEGSLFVSSAGASAATAIPMMGWVSLVVLGFGLVVVARLVPRRE
jgi:hypothetical protein